jgi:hypothetical protein
MKKEFIAEREKCMQKKYAIDNLFILSEKKRKRTHKKSEGDGGKKDTCLLVGTKAKARNSWSPKVN